MLEASYISITMRGQDESADGNALSLKTNRCEVGMNLIKSFWIVILAVGVSTALAQERRTDLYMSITGVQGYSASRTNPGEFPVTSWEWSGLSTDGQFSGPGVVKVVLPARTHTVAIVERLLTSQTLNQIKLSSNIYFPQVSSGFQVKSTTLWMRDARLLRITTRADKADSDASETLELSAKVFRRRDELSPAGSFDRSPAEVCWNSEGVVPCPDSMKGW